MWMQGVYSPEVMLFAERLIGCHNTDEAHRVEPVSLQSRKVARVDTAQKHHEEVGASRGIVVKGNSEPTPPAGLGVVGVHVGLHGFGIATASDAAQSSCLQRWPVPHEFGGKLYRELFLNLIFCRHAVPVALYRCGVPLTQVAQY
jgi:hypothetical protein